MNNICNKLISPLELNRILNKHLKIKNCITDKNVSLFRKAFMHKSFLIVDHNIDPEDRCCVLNIELNSSNERLEFFGDSVLNLAAGQYLFDRFPDKNEGFLTRLRTRLVRDKQLSFLAEKLGFKEWLLISPHVEKLGGRDNPRLLEDVYESFIAAIYITIGFYECRDFIFSCYDKYVNLDDIINNNDNYKDILLRFFQVNSWNHPVYDTFLQEGGVTDRIFTTSVLVKKEFIIDSSYLEKIQNNHNIIIQKYNIKDCENFYLEVAFGKTKKESQQKVSLSAMKLLNIPNNF
jgi:ribonuclease-3